MLEMILEAAGYVKKTTAEQIIGGTLPTRWDYLQETWTDTWDDATIAEIRSIMQRREIKRRQNLIKHARVWSKGIGTLVILTFLVAIVMQAL